MDSEPLSWCQILLCLEPESLGPYPSPTEKEQCTVDGPWTTVKASVKPHPFPPSAPETLSKLVVLERAAAAVDEAAGLAQLTT